MRRRGRKSKNINSVDVFKGLWVRPMRKGCDRREQSFRQLRKRCDRREQSFKQLRKGCDRREQSFRQLRKGCDRREQSNTKQTSNT